MRQAVRTLGLVIVVAVLASAGVSAAGETGKAAEPSKPADAGKKEQAPPPVWTSFSSADGTLAWTEPTGWVLDDKSVEGVRMVWHEPGDAGGLFTVSAYAKTAAKLEDLVRAAAYGAKPKAHKAWMCAQGDHGGRKVVVAARPLPSGDSLVVVLEASPATFKKLGGMNGVRKAADSVFGFAPTKDEGMPGD